MLDYLKPHVLGGQFPTAGIDVRKAFLGQPYDAVVDPGSPQQRPIVRIPVAASSWLYDEDCGPLGSAGGRCRRRRGPCCGSVRG